jgi:hypothetical protein
LAVIGRPEAPMPSGSITTTAIRITHIRTVP